MTLTKIILVYDEKVVSRKIPVFQELPPSIPELAPVEDGMEVDKAAANLRIKYVKSDKHVQIFRKLRDSLPIIGYKVLDIMEEKKVAAKKKAQQKESLKKQVDVKMVDVTAGPSKETIDKLVAAEVSRQIKRLPKKNGGGSGQNSSVGPSKPRQPSQSSRKASNQGPKVAGVKRKATPSKGAGSSKKSKKSTYPDEILEVPEVLAHELLMLRATRQDRQIAASRSGIHLGPGVSSLIYEFSPDVYASLMSAGLGAGLKYMFPSSVSTELPRKAYEEWCNTIRWKWHLRDEPEDADFDPDLYIRKNKLAEEGPQFLENGLSQGRRTLLSMLRPLEKALASSSIPSIPNSVQTKELSDIMTRFKLLCLPSDKNLGVTLVTREWFIEQALAHLSQPNSYRKLDRAEAFELLREQENKIRMLAAHQYARGKDKKESQLQTFLTQFTDDMDDHPERVIETVPRFYIIPKIHKSPWKGRPIMPGHSALHSPAAKMASKMLKPLVDAQPYVIKGTKDFIQKIEQLRFDERDQIWIVGGDIEAY
ncbi:hypothetical protein RhiJN_16257 [Ceratobasidium sp. AG-Ba]|nr:hypothetical protein RhiJN_16257 [Ceratobasidium sp. AG-Ba]